MGLIRFIMIVLARIKREYRTRRDIMKSSSRSSKSLTIRENSGQVLFSHNRLCIFSHFDIHNIIDPHVINHIRMLANLNCSTVFVSACEQLNENEINKIVPYVSKIIVKKNIGLDFGSWKVGLDSVADLSHYQQIILYNDSVYGPLFDLQEAFSKMEGKNLDIWGITDSWQVAFHVQSYFLVFNSSAIKSDFFKNFWQSYRFISEKKYVIANYEVGLSQQAIHHGLKVGALCNYYDVHANVLIEEHKILGDLECLSDPVNSTHTFWQPLIKKFKCPFLKVELLRNNPSAVPDIWLWPQVIAEHTNYDPTLAMEHLKRVSHN